MRDKVFGYEIPRRIKQKRVISSMEKSLVPEFCPCKTLTREAVLGKVFKVLSKNHKFVPHRTSLADVSYEVVRSIGLWKK